MKRALKADRTSLVAKYLRLVAHAKEAYKKSDALLDELEKEFSPGDTVKIESGKLTGKTFAFVDKFQEKNRIAVGMNARRYEFQEVTTP